MTATSPDLSTMLDLTGRTAVVTGGAMGIGKAVAHMLGAAGAKVVIADADAEACELTRKELAGRGFEVMSVKVDVAHEREVDEMVDAVVGWYDGIDILVNDAGIFPNVPVLEMTLADFRRVVDVNLTGLFLCSRTVARHMVDRQQGGRIVNITSIDALHPSTVGLAHYDASKHGAWGFTKNLALELAPHHIWVNAIAPGAVATPGVAHMSAAAPGGPDPQQVLAGFLEKIPMRRMGEPDDIAKVALFLASDMASYMTGSQVVVDGGVLLT